MGALREDMAEAMVIAATDLAEDEKALEPAPVENEKVAGSAGYGHGHGHFGGLFRRLFHF